MPIKQSLNQKLEFKLSPQQIQLLSFLQTPNILLESKLKEEVEKNIVLEFEEEEFPKSTAEDLYSVKNDYKSETNIDYDNDDKKFDDALFEFEDKRFINLKDSKNIFDLLEEQLSAVNFTTHELFIAKYIIRNLEDDGLLHRSINIIIDELLFKNNIETTESEFNYILKKIQSLGPTGIAATSLQECLLMQLEKISDHNLREWVKAAKVILLDYFQEFVNSKYNVIKNQLKIDDDLFSKIVENIKKLHPRPANLLLNTTVNNQVINPDFIVTKDNNQFKIQLTKSRKSKLKINDYYKNLFNTYSKQNDNSSKEVIKFLKEKIQNAESLIGNLKSRDDILLDTMSFILEKQKDYFMTADEVLLKPLILKDIADHLKISISSVSRIINSKYVQTEFGIYSLRHFFVENYENEHGEVINSREIKQLIKEIIDNEDKKNPLTDKQIIEELKKKNYNLIRRTVANYRKKLNIPTAVGRKKHK